MAKKRDYAAEYRRRVIAKTGMMPEEAKRRGVKLAAARGHTYEAESGMSESQYRRHRNIIKYGGTTSELYRLRKKVLAHVGGELASVKTSRSAKMETIRKGLLMLTKQSLEYILEMGANEIKSVASFGIAPENEYLWRALDFNEVADAVEEGDIQRNPLWYH